MHPCKAAGSILPSPIKALCTNKFNATAVHGHISKNFST